MKQVLIIEDEILIQKSLNKLISSRGHLVTAVSSGNEAISLINSNKYDRIICDLMLQDITGFDVIEEAKKSYSLNEIKNLFVIITAYSSDHVLKKASDYGCNILSKPFDDLNQALEIMLDKIGEV